MSIREPRMDIVRDRATIQAHRIRGTCQGTATRVRRAVHARLRRIRRRHTRLQLPHRIRLTQVVVVEAGVVIRRAGVVAAAVAGRTSKTARIR